MGWLRDVIYTRSLRRRKLRRGEVSRDVVEAALRQMADRAASGNTRSAALRALETVESARRRVIIR